MKKKIDLTDVSTGYKIIHKQIIMYKMKIAFYI